MQHIQKLNSQIVDTQKLIDNTHTLMSENPDDSMLKYMITQDEALLATLQYTKVQETLAYLKNITSPMQLIEELYPQPPFEISPFDVANKLGIKVIKNNFLDDSEAGKCYINNEIIIEYKGYTSHNRERFTVAHELGHVVKHMAHSNNTSYKDSTELLYARNGYIDSIGPEEEEADMFAGELLVPRKKLDLLISSIDGENQISTKLLGDIFKVAEGTIYHALKRYGLSQSLKIKEEYSWL